MKRAIGAAGIAAVALAFGAARGDGGRVVVEAVGLRSDSGRVRCGLYDAPERFLKGPTRAEADCAIHGGHATCELRVSAGTYAISCFHDENDNSRLDTNWLGIPKEGVGASNDAHSVAGPPRYQDAKFDYAGGDKRMTIRLRF